MKHVFFSIFTILALAGCSQKEDLSRKKPNAENIVHYAKGLSILRYDGYSVVKITNPWPNANKDFTYVLKEKNTSVPDSLKDFEIISVRARRIIATSTTHIPSIEMLGVQNSLVGFPGLDYISSENIRKRIEAKTIRELGSNQSLNTEVVIDLQPDVFIGYGIDNSNPALDNLQRSGIKVMINGDWNEESPLGKAEWIKFFGEIFGKQKMADSIFEKVESDYKETLTAAGKLSKKPTVLIGGMFENRWSLPKGESWGALFIRDAGGHYLWDETKGSGSLTLPFEAVLERAKNAEVWIAPGQYSSLSEMLAANPHYNQFNAFVNKNVYLFKKGKTGGVIYYELGPNRPDLVLKDVLKILHPELLPGYQLHFFEKLK